MGELERSGRNFKGQDAESPPNALERKGAEAGIDDEQLFLSTLILTFLVLKPRGKGMGMTYLKLGKESLMPKNVITRNRTDD